MSKEEHRRELIRRVMSAPIWAGVERGVYVVELDIENGRAVEISLEEAVLIRQVNRLLQRVVEENKTSLVTVVGSEEIGELVDRVWRILEQAQSVAYIDGQYQVALDEAHVVSFYLTEWDGALLERYDRLLRKLYKMNREAIDEALREEDTGAGDASEKLLKAA